MPYKSKEMEKERKHIQYINNKINMLQLHKNRYYKLKQDGKCITCTKKSHSNSVYCIEHIWKHLLQSHKISDEQATKILESQNYTCPWTGRKLIKGANASVDHIIPIGKHRKDKNHPLNELSNIQFVDKDLQYFKKDKTENDLKVLIDDIIKYKTGGKNKWQML